MADFSDLGGISVTEATPLDFSDLGGKRVTAPPPPRPAANTALWPSHGAQPAPQEQPSQEMPVTGFESPASLPSAADVGRMLPEGSEYALAAANRYLVQPFERIAQRGAQIGRQTSTYSPDIFATLTPAEESPYTTPEESARANPILTGVTKGVGSVLGSTAADPRNWPFMGSSAARPLLQRVISGGFGAVMGESAIDTASNLYENWDRLTPEQRAEMITSGGLSAVMAVGAARHAVSPFDDLGAVPVEQPAPDFGDLGALSAAPAPAGGQVGTMRTADIAVDPARFQYKTSTDARGTSTLLKEAQQFNPDLAGVLTVWRDPADGQVYVINGHHRLELAQRMGQPEVAVRTISAANDTEARSIGALQNIAEGRGTAVDAAKFFRDSGIGPEDLRATGISMGEATASRGLALSRLDDSLFQRVAQGDMPEGRAVAIGAATENPAQQRAVADLIDAREARGQHITDATVSELIRFAQSSGETTETTADLFGERQVTQSLAIEKAEVSAYVQQQVARDQRLFGFVSQQARAQRLGEAGNVMALDANRRISTEAAQAAEVYNRLSERVGPVDDILNSAAARIAQKGASPNAIKQQAYSQIRDQISQTLAGAEATRTGGGGEAAPAAAPGLDFADLGGRRLEPLFAPGPGAKTAGPSEMGGTALSQLTGWIEGKRLSEPAPFTESAAANVGRTLASISKSASDAWNGVRTTTHDLWDSYTHPAAWTDFKDAVGKYQGDLQHGDWEVSQFAKAIKAAVPDKTHRVAITNWIQAGGDAELLRARAAASSPELRPGYEAALRLTPDEMTLARNIQTHFEAKLDEAIQAGLLTHGIDNYVREVWQKDPGNIVAQNLRASAAANDLAPNPSFIKKRVFDSYYDGEQAGFIPKDKDIGALVASYNVAFNRAIASRAFIKALHEGEATDGRPLAEVAGSGIKLEGAAPNGPDAWIVENGHAVPNPDAAPSTAYLVRPRTKPGAAYDYVTIDHPALRDWKWVTKDDAGNPVLLKGDMLAHPEAAHLLKNVLSTSAIRESAFGRAILTGSAFFKQTLLTLSPFHQVQIGVHALEHTVDPFRAPKLDLNDATQRALVDHGLMVSDFRGMEEFSEGVAATGLVAKLPGIGAKMSEYQNYLFRDYIPRVKMSMATHALERNIERYGSELTRDQILELTANQANAAFGHLNYRMMGRNPTLQDTFRLFALAPDFLEARARFVGQAFKPYGREQARALALGAAGLVVGKAIIGQITGEEQDWSLDHLLFVKIGGREYSLRTIQGDLLHLATSPRTFVSTRLNPAVTRPLMEAVTGRDQWGRQRDVYQQLKDYFKTAVPIPLKGLVDSGPQSFVDTLLQSIGVTSKKYRPPQQH